MRFVILATLATLAGLALTATPASAQNAWLGLQDDRRDVQRRGRAC